MERSSILQKLADGELVVETRRDLELLLPTFEVIREVDTLLAGPLFIIETDVGTAILEYPPQRDKAILRPFESLEAANAFVDDRLATYERMWDGCGCKIDYFKGR